MVGIMFYVQKSKGQEQDVLDTIKWGMRYYQDRYNKEPEVCIVHPSRLDELKSHDLDIEIRAEKYVFPRNIWIGYEQDKPEEN